MNLCVLAERGTRWRDKFLTEESPPPRRLTASRCYQPERCCFRRVTYLVKALNGRSVSNAKQTLYCAMQMGGLLNPQPQVEPASLYTEQKKPGVSVTCPRSTRNNKTVKQTATGFFNCPCPRFCLSVSPGTPEGDQPWPSGASLISPAGSIQRSSRDTSSTSWSRCDENETQPVRCPFRGCQEGVPSFA